MADIAADAQAGIAAAGKGRRRDLSPLFMLKPYLRRYPAMCIAALVSLTSAAVATLVLPLGVRRMIDLGFAGGNGAFVDRYFAVMVAIGAILALASAARFYTVSWLGERVVADLAGDVFRRLSTQSPGFFETAQSGEVMSRLTADTTQIKSAIGTAFSQTLRNVVLLLGALVMMFVTSTKLSVLVLGLIPLIVIPLVIYGRVVKRLSRTAQDSLATASAYAAENLASVRTMQAAGAEAQVTGRFAGALELAFQAAGARMRARAGLTAVALFLVFAGIVGILWLGAGDVLAGRMSGGTLGQFVLYAVFAAGALGGLSEVFGEAAQAAGAAERLAELLAHTPEIRSPERPVAFPNASRGEVVFDAVTFRYPSRPEVAALDAVSFRVKPGETVAIVGPSGAGKSTIFNLVLRFYDPSGGSVRVDGVDVRQAELAALRSRAALVPQEVALFADTLAENIRYGMPEATRADIERAATTAESMEFIARLPDGLDTKAGERGVTLSGGQRQRIAIARAILRNAPILLLDEATSALDAESEAKVQAALERIMGSRTTLVIAHRLATVQKADRILVLDQGRLVEEGTHQSLIAKGGIYSRLAGLQFAA
ncbi:MAG: ABC transporter transmembrane domain-containing protein [Hyphomicrobiaceae bacterium]